jgi:hypothetical protein
VIIFYVVCALVCLALVLCNLHFAENKLTTAQAAGFTVASLIPFVNALIILFTFYVAYDMAKAEIEREGKK